MELKRAITQFLSEKLNDAFQHFNGLTAERPFVFATDFDRDLGEFQLFDDNGKLVIDEHLNYVKYFPSSVYSIIADRVEIPNLQMLDAIIPVEIFVPVDRVQEIIEILNYFQEIINGVPFTLTANYLDNDETTYNILMTFNLPDDDAFLTYNGINGKIIDFQISANITVGILYGNSIQYELSLDDGNTYTPIIKSTPETILEIVDHAGQIVNDSRTKSTPQTAVWTFNSRAIVLDNSPLRKLFYYVDIPYEYLEQDYIFEKTWLKITYNFLAFINSVSHLGLTSSVNKEYYFMDGYYFNCYQTAHTFFPNMLMQHQNAVGTYYLKDIKTGLDLIKIDVDMPNHSFKLYLNNVEIITNGTCYGTDFDVTYLGEKLASYKCDTENLKYIVTLFKNRKYLFYGNGSNINDVIIDMICPNYFTKPVMISSLTRTDENADIMTLDITLKDRLEEI